MRLHWQEGHSHAIFAGRRQGETQPGAFPHEEFVGNLDEHPGAVAGVALLAGIV